MNGEGNHTNGRSSYDRIVIVPDANGNTINGHFNCANKLRTWADKKASNENGENEDNGNQFLREIVNLIIDEKRIVGNGDHIRRQNKKLIEFRHPKELEALLDLKITQDGLSDDELLELCKKTIDYSVKTTHPHFYNQLYAGVDQYSLAGSWITEALNTSQATYEISPVFTLMERELIKYLGSFCNWDKDSIDGIFSPGGSIANMYGVILGRHTKFPDSKKAGIRNLGDIVLFVSEDAHYSFVKSAIWMGLGSDAVIKVKSDDYGCMDPFELEKAIIRAKRENQIPFFVGCTGGTTVLGAFDPLQPISRICQKYQLWLHVDAALGGTVLFSSKHRHLLDGIEFADSVAWNLHKLAAIPLQCSAFLTRHRNVLSECNSLHAEYIFQNDKYYDASYDSGDKSIQCGRKVDSFKLWLALSARGENNMSMLVDNIFDMVKYTTEEIKKRNSFKLVLNEFQSNNVCFWYLPKSLRYLREDDENHFDAVKCNQKLHTIAPLIKSKMMTNGTLMIGYQPLTSKKLPNFFRLVFTCIPETRKSDIDFLLDEIESIGNQL